MDVARTHAGLVEEVYTALNHLAANVEDDSTSGSITGGSGASKAGAHARAVLAAAKPVKTADTDLLSIAGRLLGRR